MEKKYRDGLPLQRPVQALDRRQSLNFSGKAQPGTGWFPGEALLRVKDLIQPWFGSSKERSSRIFFFGGGVDSRDPESFEKLMKARDSSEKSTPKNTKLCI